MLQIKNSITPVLLDQCWKLDRSLLPDSTWSLEQWRKITYFDYYRLFYLLDDKQQLVGFSLWQVDLLDNFAHLLKIAVATIHKGKGYGKQLLQESEYLLQQEGITKFYLEVAKSNTVAISLYKHLKYLKIREIKQFYQSGEDAEIYLKTL
jgi:ribosomal-protein-alanine acetyltransferase